MVRLPVFLMVRAVVGLCCSFTASQPATAAPHVPVLAGACQEQDEATTLDRVRATIVHRRRSLDRTRIAFRVDVYQGEGPRVPRFADVKPEALLYSRQYIAFIDGDRYRFEREEVYWRPGLTSIYPRRTILTWDGVEAQAHEFYEDGSRGIGIGGWIHERGLFDSPVVTWLGLQTVGMNYRETLDAALTDAEVVSADGAEAGLTRWHVTPRDTSTISAIHVTADAGGELRDVLVELMLSGVETPLFGGTQRIEYRQYAEGWPVASEAIVSTMTYRGEERPPNWNVARIEVLNVQSGVEPGAEQWRMPHEVFENGARVVDERFSIGYVVGGRVLNVNGRGLSVVEPLSGEIGFSLPEIVARGAWGPHTNGPVRRHIPLVSLLFVVCAVCVVVPWRVFKNRGKRSLRVAVLTLGLLMLTACGGTEDDLGHVRGTEGRPTPASEEGSSGSNPEYTVVDFGSVQIDKGPVQVSRTVGLENKESRVIEIDRVAASCGCVISETETDVLEPGSTTTLTVHLTVREVGPTEQTVYVLAGGEPFKRYKLRANGVADQELRMIVREPGLDPATRTVSCIGLLIDHNQVVDSQPLEVVSPAEARVVSFGSWRVIEEFNEMLRRPWQRMADVVIEVPRSANEYPTEVVVRTSLGSEAKVKLSAPRDVGVDLAEAGVD